MTTQEKADAWDALEAEIAPFYTPIERDDDDESDEEIYEKEGDLSDIGELAARAFGFL